ncbi:MAG: SPFH domain-containing protein [Eubacteriales bacterium]|nr:SPFH domain-containing protein [Eubacteriales bacterium]
MAISQVITFEGSPNDLVWKSPYEDFNTTSQLIVPPTHEALFVMNGTAADLFGEGRHTLTTSNLPFLRKLIEIPTGGKTSFPCQVYYINKVHQMDMLWGTKDAFPVEDPLYEIFLHVMIHGSLSFSVIDSRKFLLKLCGLRDRFTPEMLVPMFRGIVAKHVKDCVAKIMIHGQLSYFMISANLLEISDVLQERLSEIFDDYGITLEFFNVETISVPKADYDSVSAAKERRTSRMIEGYTWQEERQMMIAEKFAGNEGSMGAMGGMMGGVAGGMMMGSSIGEIAKNALNLAGNNGMARPGTGGAGSVSMGVYSDRNTARGMDVVSFMKNGSQAGTYGQPVTTQNGGAYMRTGMMSNSGAYGQQEMSQNGGAYMQQGMMPNGGAYGQPGTAQNNGMYVQSGTAQNSSMPVQPGMQDPYAEYPQQSAVPVQNTAVNEDGPAAMQAPAADTGKAARMARLKELKELYDLGLIEEDEFKEGKAEILAQLKKL